MQYSSDGPEIFLFLYAIHTRRSLLLPYLHAICTLSCIQFLSFLHAICIRWSGVFANFRCNMHEIVFVIFTRNTHQMVQSFPYFLYVIHVRRSIIFTVFTCNMHAIFRCNTHWMANSFCHFYMQYAFCHPYSF